MFNSPRLSRLPNDTMTIKRILDEKCQTIEHLKNLIDELKLRHEKKEQELIKHIGILYNDLQQNKRKMAHLILKHQQYKKFNEKIKSSKDSSIQTDENTSSSNYSTYNTDLKSNLTPTKTKDQHPKYYTLHTEDNIEYISATPQPPSDHSLSSPCLSTTDRSSTKHNESSSSAYNTAESLPSSTYSDEVDSLERVLNAACTMYTTHDNLQHTIKLQEELFRQRLRLRGIQLDDNNDTSSEHFYDNIDGETSDIEKQTVFQNRSLPWSQKKAQRTVTFNINKDEQEDKIKMTPNKVKFNDQYYSIGKRKNFKTNNKKANSHHSNVNNKKLFSSKMLTVTIT